MVNEILSNQEIDTLLELFRSEGADADSPDATPLSLAGVKEEEGPVVRPVDLLKPNRLGREKLLSLERNMQSAAKLLSATISDRLRLETQCDCVAVEQMRFQSWLSQLPGPVAIYVLKMEPFSMPVLFTASTSLLYGAVDRILGGSGRIPRVPVDFTSAEYTVADAMVGPCLDRICESMGEVLDLSWSIESRFCNPSMANILPAQDVVLSIYFQAAGDFLIGDLRLVIPFAALEPHLGELGRRTTTAQEPGAMRDAVGQSLRGVGVEMGVRLGETTIPLRHLLSLREGDVVPVGTRIGQPVVAPVQGVPKFRGQVGTRGNRLAFQVLEVLES